MKEIKLQNGMVAKVDDADYEYLSQFSWRAFKRKNTWYAERTVGRPEGRFLFRRTLSMHRDIMRPDKDMKVDHADHDGLNNQRGNLRICTNGQNNMNSRMRKGKKVSYKGVSTSGKKYTVHVCQKYIGTYSTPEEAARVYDKHAKELFGEFAFLNFPEK